ncbi:hypothetical protein HQN60_15955 (plasmid) [Deefgea piscis]|jgi:tRNA(Glu) U13 pseudouridine synthase TruD|uniref:Uncharacterized protein n=1 Tax=Deefgea piscis TaxID=2739061 RepID=A0A6M8SSK1_9NEIS|nr:hypothetical protein [Deefgea piscis]QKJ68302.1 hypothetical protein HQN60_15955 [Deefgea piscis]
MSKTASLTSGLVAKKGQAAPAVVQHDALETKPQVLDYYKALTVKLDRERYEALKNAGIKLDKKSQEIFVEALDSWLKQIA